jgi:hypothetical protein
LEYNYRFDTSIPFGLEDQCELRARKIKVLWCQLAFLLLEKGDALVFKYWNGDLWIKDGYSRFGMEQIRKMDEKAKRTIDLDGLMLMQVELTKKMKDFVLQSIIKSEQRISPFFHFDVLDGNGDSLCTAQDFGETVLMELTEGDLSALFADGFDLSFLIALPEPYKEANG